MKKRNKLLDLLPLMVMWLVLSVLVWGWIFNLLTDTKPENKLTLFIDAQVENATDLAVAMEGQLTGDVRMAKVHPFTYAMMSADALQTADLYIARASMLAEYGDWVRPLPEELCSAGETIEHGGEQVGLLFRRAGEDGPLSAYVTYDMPGAAPEDYYLFVGAGSCHAGDGESVDDQAVAMALYLLGQP